MKSTTEDIELECYSHRFLRYEGKKKEKNWEKKHPEKSFRSTSAMFQV